MLSSPPTPGGEGNKVTVSLLPGSRDRYVRALLPYLLRVADALQAIRPRVTFQIIAAEFLSPEFLTAMRMDATARWPALNIVWITRDPWTALARSDLALTFPGTSTVELAMLGVPFAAIVPLEFIDRVPAEGLLEWIGRIPGVGRSSGWRPGDTSHDPGCWRCQTSGPGRQSRRSGSAGGRPQNWRTASVICWMTKDAGRR